MARQTNGARVEDGIERARPVEVRAREAAAREAAERLDRTRRYLDACRELGLNAATHPLAVVTRDGREVLRATARATDQLAARHRLTREVIVGPRVLTGRGRTVVHAACRVRAPDGREAVAEAVVPFGAHPDSAFMSCETRAKHLATLAVLGLEAYADPDRDPGVAGLEAIEAAVLDVTAEPFAIRTVSGEPIGAGVQNAGRAADARAITDVPHGDVPIASRGIDTVAEPLRGGARVLEGTPPFRVVDAVAAQPAPAAEDPARAAATTAAREALAGFYESLARVTTPDDAVALWLARRASLASLPREDGASAWAALCARTQRLGITEDARAFLKRAIAARAAAPSTG